MEINTHKSKYHHKIPLQLQRWKSGDRDRILGASRGFAIAETSLTLFFIFSTLSMFFASSLLIEKKKVLLLTKLKTQWIEMDKKYEN